MGFFDETVELYGLKKKKNEAMANTTFDVEFNKSSRTVYSCKVRVHNSNSWQNNFDMPCLLKCVQFIVIIS